MLKKLERLDPGSCLNKALPDEMLFVLLARDRCAPETIRYWAYLRAGGRPLDFVVPPTAMSSPESGALYCADIMDDTRNEMRSALNKAPVAPLKC